MDFTPEDLRDLGIARLGAVKAKEQNRRAYADGKHELPFAPQGVNVEYEALRDMSPVPLIRLALRTPVQRLRIGGIRTGASESTDKATWDVWQFNRLDSRQRIVYLDGLVYEKGGVVSVWPNAADPDRPFIRVEDPLRVHVEPDPEDPFSALWAVKRWAETATTPLGQKYDRQVVLVYSDGFVWRYETTGPSTAYELVDVFDNPLGRVPFVRFVPEVDSNGSGTSMVDALIPMQRAVDTIRFDLLLAAQFAAFRQRVVVGYDPVLRDEEGNPVVQKDAEGNPILDANGMSQPITASPGRVGVDRLLVFPGDSTKVFDLDESNLANYVTALDMLLATFASTAQVPPQYLVGDFKNVSGDLMVATEATLLSFVTDLQTAYGESWEQVFTLANIARGASELPLATEVVWDDASPKSIAAIGSAMAQMVPNGAPARMFLEMLPGATQQKVERWMGMSQDALQRALAGDLAAMTGPKPEGGSDGIDPDGALPAG